MHLNLYFFLHPNLSHCSATSVTDSNSTTGCAASKCRSLREHDATEKKCYEHLCILHVYDPVLYSIVDRHVGYRNLSQPLDKSLELYRHCLLYELLY